MPFNVNGKNAQVDGLAAVIGAVSVHDAIPDAAGNNEVSGGSYQRQTVSWSAAAAGVRDNDAQISHDMPSGSTAIAYGFWDSTGGSTFYGHALVGSTAQGFGAVDASGVSGDAISSAAHGLSDDDRVALYPVDGGTLPTGLSEGTLYHVVGSTTDTFQVATTQGGSAVTITAEGELWWQNCVPESFGSSGTLQCDTGDLDLNANTL